MLFDQEVVHIGRPLDFYAQKDTRTFVRVGGRMLVAPIHPIFSPQNLVGLADWVGEFEINKWANQTEVHMGRLIVANGHLLVKSEVDKNQVVDPQTLMDAAEKTVALLRVPEGVPVYYDPKKFSRDLQSANQQFAIHHVVF